MSHLSPLLAKYGFENHGNTLQTRLLLGSDAQTCWLQASGSHFHQMTRGCRRWDRILCWEMAPPLGRKYRSRGLSSGSIALWEIRSRLSTPWSWTTSISVKGELVVLSRSYVFSHLCVCLTDHLSTVCLSFGLQYCFHFGHIYNRVTPDLHLHLRIVYFLFPNSIHVVYNHKYFCTALMWQLPIHHFPWK